MLTRELGDRIRERREGLGLTQRDVAAALQVSNQAVSKWERGENAPDIEALAPLARLLGVSVDWLLGTQGRDGDVFEATVSFSDVRGFGPRFAALGERDGAVLLNGLLSQMTEAVLRHGGVPVKYIGDTLLAFFAGAGHRERGVRAALLAHLAVGERLGVTVGLHSGSIYLGRIGHADYARADIIGPTVDIASRVQRWAGSTPHGLAASGATVAGLDGTDLTSAAGPGQEVAIGGAHAPAVLHELRPTPEPARFPE
jgi:class 3 adenylate cyclase